MYLIEYQFGILFKDLDKTGIKRESNVGKTDEFGVAVTAMADGSKENTIGYKHTTLCKGALFM